MYQLKFFIPIPMHVYASTTLEQEIKIKSKNKKIMIET